MRRFHSYIVETEGVCMVVSQVDNGHDIECTFGANPFMTNVALQMRNYPISLQSIVMPFGFYRIKYIDKGLGHGSAHRGTSLRRVQS